jgi:hypothetical protein
VLVAMAFFASLFAYVFAVGGIVLALAMSYAVLLAPPSEQPPNSSRAVAAVVSQTSSQASSPSGVKTPAVRRDASHLAQAEAARKSRGAAGRKTLAANEATRQRRAGSPDAAYAGLWAFQRPPDLGGWRFGYAEEEANGSNRGW